MRYIRLLKEKITSKTAFPFTPGGFGDLPGTYESLLRKISDLELSDTRKTKQAIYYRNATRRLEKQSDTLRKANELLSLDLGKALDANAGLRKKIKLEQQQVAVLQEQLRIAKMPRNSSNSSRPPSTDLFKPNRNTSLREKSGKKSGGQPGHKGATLLRSENKADVTLIHAPSYCGSCGQDLSGVDAIEEYMRQLIDVPCPRYIITNHITCKKVCPCGHCNHGSFPANVNSPVSYGPGVEALVVNLSTRQYIPYNRLSTLIRDLYGIQISEGTIANMLERFGRKAACVYERIRQQIFKAEVVGSDETSAHVNGSNHWLHTYQSDQWTFIGYHPSRGAIARDTFYPHGLPNAILVTDCLAMQLSTETREHQVCLSHLLRELNAMQQDYPMQDWPTQIKVLLKKAMDLKKGDYTLQQVEQVRQKFRELLKVDQSQAPGKIEAFWKRMLKHEDKIFTFLYHDNVPSDNNGSERAIRNIKVKQKVSGQFKTPKGAQQYAENRSIIDTANKQGKNVHEALVKIANLVPE
jgi:transposase